MKSPALHFERTPCLTQPVCAALFASVFGLFYGRPTKIYRKSALQDFAAVLFDRFHRTGLSLGIFSGCVAM